MPVDDAKSVKNRVHLDVAPYEGEDQGLEVARLVALGARRIDVGQGPDVSWVVLAGTSVIATPNGRAPRPTRARAGSWLLGSPARLLDDLFQGLRSAVAA